MAKKKEKKEKKAGKRMSKKELAALLTCYTTFQMTIIFPKLKKESSASTITERR